MVKVSQEMVKLLIWQLLMILLINQAHGMLIKVKKLVRVEKMIKIFLAEHPDIMNEIEEKVKAQIFAHEEA